MIRGWIYGLALLAIVVALSALAGSNIVLADRPWPVPPPGPEPLAPKVVDDSGIRPVEAPAVPGAASWVVRPLAMLLPRFPPVPTSSFQSPDGLTIISDAGSIDSTVQLVYEPIPIASVPPPAPQQELRRAFNLRTFDPQGKQVGLNLLRPWVVEVPIQGLLKPFEDSTRLLLARYDEGGGWVPQVTSYHRTRGILQVRVLKMGRFAVLIEPTII